MKGIAYIQTNKRNVMVMSSASANFTTTSNPNNSAIYHHRKFPKWQMKGMTIYFFLFWGVLGGNVVKGYPPRDY